MEIEIWVDGSFIENSATWAFLVYKDGKEFFKNSGVLTAPAIKKYYQVAGELSAALKALQWCTTNNVNNVTLYYDYEGIHSWAVDAWKANNPVTREYKTSVQAFLSKVNVTWKKVKAHSGNKNNNIVDKMAKTSAISTIYKDRTKVLFNEKCYILDFNKMEIIKDE